MLVLAAACEGGLAAQTARCREKTRRAAATAARPPAILRFLRSIIFIILTLFAVVAGTLYPYDVLHAASKDPKDRRGTCFKKVMAEKKRDSTPKQVSCDVYYKDTEKDRDVVTS